MAMVGVVYKKERTPASEEKFQKLAIQTTGKEHND